MRCRPIQILMFLLLGGVGCGPNSNTVRVSGEVSFKGEPVQQGEITFRPLQGTKGPATGGAIENGQYDIPADKGPQAGGAYRVEILGLKDSGRVIETGMGDPVPAFDYYIPPQFNTKSKLEVSIPTGGSEFQQDYKL